MALAATVERYRELGFRVIEGGRSGKCAVLKSPAIAEIFGVRHLHVLRDVRAYQEILEPNLGQGFAEHCRPATYRAADGKDQPCFELTKVGFSTIAAKYDCSLRFLLALAFDALEHNDDSADVIRQINQRIRELRSRASGQDELNLDVLQTTDAPTAPTGGDNDDDDLDDTKARHIWHREAPLNDNKPVAPNALALDRWIDNGWHVRRRYDTAGNPLMVWVTSDDAISTPQQNKMLIPSPNGKYQIGFCFNNPFPPIEVVLRTYDSLGSGPYAPIAKATLKHFLT